MTPQEYKYEYNRRYRQREDVKEKRRIAGREYYAKNKGRRAEYAKRHREANKDRINEWHRNHNLKIKYGITQVEFEALFKSQGSSCKICGTQEARTKFPWHVDHDHETDKIRGILCHHCNLILGHSSDNVGILKRAIEYLSSQ